MHLFLRLSTIFKIDFFHCDNFGIVKPAKLLAIDMYETFIIYYLLLFLSSDFLQSFQWETIFATPCLLSCTSRSFRNSVYCKRSKLILQKTFIDKKGKIILDRIKALHMYPFPINLDDAQLLRQPRCSRRTLKKLFVRTASSRDKTNLRITAVWSDASGGTVGSKYEKSITRYKHMFFFIIICKNVFVRHKNKCVFAELSEHQTQYFISNQDVFEKAYGTSMCFYLASYFPITILDVLIKRQLH